jgi:peptide deformylase
MTELRIVKVGDADDAVLYRPAARVREFGPRLHHLLDEMWTTVRKAPGVGLAAPQVGVDQRITVIEYPEDEDRPEETMRTYELINPEILKSKGAEVGQEGCLSLPGLAADIERATYVLVRAQDRRGKEFRLKAYDWLARILQHEIDHLRGVMMTDKAKQLYKLREKEDGTYEAIPIDEALLGRHRLRATE